MYLISIQILVLSNHLKCLVVKNKHFRRLCDDKIQGWQNVSNSGGAQHNCILEKVGGGPKRLYLLISQKSGGAQAPLAPPVLPPLHCKMFPIINYQNIENQANNSNLVHPPSTLSEIMDLEFHSRSKIEILGSQNHKWVTIKSSLKQTS